MSETAKGATVSEDVRDERLETLHAIILMMLRDFSLICEKEGIPWIASFGTALGALRNGGFIPWDDDADICIMRCDLERLGEAVKRDFSDKYEVISAKTHPRYPMLTARLALKGTEFRDDALATMDFPSCIFLDLFPLDNLADEDRAFRRQAWRSWLFNKLAICKLVKQPCILAGGIKGKALKMGTAFMRGVLNLPGVRSIDLNGRAYAWHTRYSDQPTKRVGFLCDTDRFWNVYELDDLFPVRMVPFESMEVPIANKAEKLLTALYGDWRTPLPAEQRTIHYPEILDFGPYAHLTLDDAAR